MSVQNPLKMSRSKQIASLICLFIMFFNRFFPPLFGLNEIGTSVLCVFFPTLFLLLFVDLVWPAIACVFAFAVSGLYTFSGAVAASFGHNILWLVIFSGMVISVLDETGVIRRIALWFISRPFARKNPWLLVTMLFLATLLIGSVSDPTALILVMTVLTKEIVQAMGGKQGDRLGTLLMMGVLMIDAVSTGITPIGHPIPIMLMEMFKDLYEVDFLKLTIFGYIIGLLLLVMLVLIMRFVFKLDLSPLKNFDPTDMYEALPPMTKRAKISVLIYGLVILFWLTPGVLKYILPDVATFVNGLSTTAPVALGVVAMCVITVDGEPIMDIQRGVTKGAPWAASFTVGIALLLGGSLNIEGAGITDALAAAGSHLGNISPLLFVIVICVICVVITTFVSNTLTATLIATVCISLLSSGIITGVHIGALVACICVVDSEAIAAATGSAFGAIVAGDGWVKPKEQLVYGGVLALGEALLVSTVGYFIATLII